MAIPVKKQKNPGSTVPQLTNQQVVELYNALSDPKLLELKGGKFVYAVAKNLQIMKPEIDSLSRVLELTVDYKKYDTERAELAKKYAKVKEDGTPETKMSVRDGNMVEEYIIANQAEFEKKASELGEKHKNVRDEREKQIEDYKELLKESSTLELHKIIKDELPADITAKQLFGIMLMVEE